MSHKIRPWLYWPEKILIGLSIITLSFMMMLTGADVIGRYFLSWPVIGAFELTEFSMAITVFSILPLVCLKRGHITADLLVGIASKRMLRFQQFLGDFCGLSLFGLLTWRLWREAGKVTEYGTTAGVLELPLGPLTYFAALLSGLCTLVFISHLTGITKNLNHGANLNQEDVQ